MRTEKKIQYKLTEILSQFEMIAEMEISKNQWRSTGGQSTLLADLNKKLGFIKKDYHSMKRSKVITIGNSAN